MLRPSASGLLKGRAKPASSVLLSGAAALFLAGCAAHELRAFSGAAYGALFTVVRPIEKERMRAPHGVRGTPVQGSIAYFVPVEGGVVLVDPGFDESGEIVHAALGERRVLAILITHGHIDHVSGAQTFRGVPVYVGENDVALVRGLHPFQALAPRLARGVMGDAPAPPDLRGVHDGERVRVGGALFRAIAVPGHTPGSTAWLYRGVLFTGDGVQSYDGEHVLVSPGFFSEDVESEWSSVRKLRGVKFSVFCDAHNGCTEDGKSKVRTAGRRHP